jgi:hypothetical protein
MGTLSTSPGQHAGVETMLSKLNQGVGVAVCPGARIATPCGARQCVERSPDRRSSNSVEVAVQELDSPFASPDFEAAVRRVLSLLGKEGLSVVRVTNVGAFIAKAGEVVRHGLFEKWPLVEPHGGRRLA